MHIVRLTGEQAENVGSEMVNAFTCLVAFDEIDGGQFKVKIDNGIWSPPMGDVIEREKGPSNVVWICESCENGEHEECSDGTRISAVKYACECAKMRHSLGTELRALEAINAEQAFRIRLLMSGLTERQEHEKIIDDFLRRSMTNPYPGE